MDYVDSYRDLKVYKLARSLAKDIFETTKNFPREEIFALTGQIRRCSRSIGGQIAEAWGKRRYVAHFVSKLTDADGEQFETRHWTDTSIDCKYISQEKADEWHDKCQQIGRMLQSMMDKADTFCQPKKV